MKEIMQMAYSEKKRKDNLAYFGLPKNNPFSPLKIKSNLNGNIHTIVYNDKQLNSLYKKADKNSFSELLKSKSTVQILMIGIGTGYELELLLKHTKAPLFIVEKKEILNTALGIIDYTKLRNHQVYFFIYENEPDLEELFPNFLKNYWQIFACNKLYLIEHPALKNIEASIFKTIHSLLKNFMDWLFIAINHEATYGKQLVINTLKNSLYFPESLSLSEIKKEKAPFITIVSAGPSLNRRLDELKLTADISYVICVDTAVKTLIANKIQPDLIVTTDYREHNKQHLINLPSEIYTLPIVFEPTVFHEILPLFNGPKILVGTIEPLFQKILHALKKNFNTFPLQAHMVSHTALMIAAIFNPQILFLFGHDFAYLGNSTHAEGSENNSNFTIKEETIITNSGKNLPLRWARDHLNQKIPTTPALLSGLKHTETIIKKALPHTLIYNLSEGAKIEGSSSNLNNWKTPAAIQKKQLNFKSLYNSSSINLKDLLLADLKSLETLINKGLAASSQVELKLTTKSIDNLLSYYQQLVAADSFKIIKRLMFKAFFTFNQIDAETISADSYQAIRDIFNEALESLKFVKSIIGAINNDRNSLK